MRARVTLINGINLSFRLVTHALIPTEKFLLIIKALKFIKPAVFNIIALFITENFSAKPVFGESGFPSSLPLWLASLLNPKVY